MHWFFSIAVEPLFPQLCLKGLPKDFRSGTPRLGQESVREKMHRSLSEEQSTEEENGMNSNSFINEFENQTFYLRYVIFLSKII